MSTVSDRTGTDPPGPPGGPYSFRYGWRYVRIVRPDGTEDHDQVPLTLEDVLHPEVGDIMPESDHPETGAEVGDYTAVSRALAESQERVAGSQERLAEQSRLRAEAEATIRAASRPRSSGCAGPSRERRVHLAWTASALSMGRTASIVPTPHRTAFDRLLQRRPVAGSIPEIASIAPAEIARSSSSASSSKAGIAAFAAGPRSRSAAIALSRIAGSWPAVIQSTSEGIQVAAV